MAKTMYGEAGKIYLPRPGHQYSADGDGLIAPDVEDADVKTMVEFGCQVLDVWTNISNS